MIILVSPHRLIVNAHIDFNCIALPHSTDSLTLALHTGGMCMVISAVMA